MRRKRDNELVYLLLRNPKGITFDKLVTMNNVRFDICTIINGRKFQTTLNIKSFPRKTLSRLLKELRKKELVERSLEPWTKGRKKGRQGTRYKISSKIMTLEGGEQDIGCGLTMQAYGYRTYFPCKKVGEMPFRGIIITRYGEPFVRLLPSEKIRMERFIAWLEYSELERSKECEYPPYPPLGLFFSFLP
jgi:hypothetical protein